MVMRKSLKIIGIILVIIIICMGSMIFSEANKEKTSINTNTFKNIMENKGYTIYDTTSQFEQYGNYMLSSCLVKNNNYQIEFYELSNTENAIDMYNTNKSKFEAQKSNMSTSTTTNMKNYSTYALTTNGQYKYISRIDNTLIYINVDENYKDSVQEIIKELGY